ncbi:group II intron maturase-specific domain-containing protein [Pseudoalteromonas arctica]|uniref:group II intron maturase-specific domain-containing protein n=1 Tax=Pseudoalteromonas arctica TaxID=394751 RepID=UPI003D7C8E10
MVHGFVNYCSIANCKRVLNILARWLRRRLRAVQLRLWKSPPFKFIKMTHGGTPYPT